MEKIRMDAPEAKSVDLISQNIEKLKTLFPELVTEGANGTSVNIDVLKQLVGDSHTLTDMDEKYGLCWHGKRKARQMALTPTLGTLRPCKEESVDWDNTKNLFIEGDNLEVLKLLQKSYSNKVKMIYIDPPYNTGKDFVYPDNFRDNIRNYQELTRQSKEGKKLSSNTESSGRFHTDWLNMMYPRLRIARNLLKEDGVIFISIDEHEINNLKNICNEVFGEENLLVNFSWRTDGNFDNQAKFKKCHEYILGYAKAEKSFSSPPVIDPNVPKNSKLYKPEVRNTIVKNGPKNPISTVVLPKGFPADLSNGIIGKRSDIWPQYLSDAKIQDGKLANEIEIQSGWSSKDLLLKFINNSCKPVIDHKGQETRFSISTSGAIEVIKKRSDIQSHVISSLSNLGGPQKANLEIQEINVVFDDYPKPLSLIKYLSKMVSGQDEIFLDFFAGSSSTAHAIMQLNKEDSYRRKFIMVQIPEVCNKSTKAFKAGYKTIAEIGKERIRRAANKIQEEQPRYKGDLGFRVFKLDSSNIQAWDPNAQDIAYTLEEHAEHLKKDRTEEDILYELLLKLGLDLCVPIKSKSIAGKTVYSIGYGVLLTCLDSQIEEDQAEALAEGIARWHQELAVDAEVQCVFRDNAFANDVTKTNLTAILEQHGIEKIRSI